MTRTASGKDLIPVEARLLVALELGWEKWRLGLHHGDGAEAVAGGHCSARCAGV